MSPHPGRRPSGPRKRVRAYEGAAATANSGVEGWDSSFDTGSRGFLVSRFATANLSRCSLQHGKTLRLDLMPSYFTSERFGRPQFLAFLLLLAFLFQAIWLVHQELRAEPLPESDEALRIEQGWNQWHGRGIAAAPLLNAAENGMQPELMNEVGGFDTQRSPLLYLVSAAPLLAWPHDLTPDSARYWRWLPRLPFLACGAFLGASLWYVARRLCGNAGGFVALTFYCFSPSLIQASAAWHSEPEIAAAWGAFGTIFTAIAVAHTLYAPREVVLWNWRRIVLLGVALALAVGSQFSLIVVIPIALAFMLYLAPTRRIAAGMIWAAACALSFLLLCASYLFHWKMFWSEMAHADFLALAWRSFAMAGAYRRVFAQLGQSNPALVVAIPVALMVYLLWPRTRYFGNTAPLLVAVILFVMAIGAPHYPGLGFQLVALPFLLVFVAGVSADLLETPYRNLVLACLWGLLTANAIWNLAELARA